MSKPAPVKYVFDVTHVGTRTRDFLGREYKEWIFEVSSSSPTLLTQLAFGFKASWWINWRLHRATKRMVRNYRRHLHQKYKQDSILSQIEICA